MERDTERRIVDSDGSTVKINSLCIDLGIVKEKDNPQKCSHFSIRGYVAKLRERSGNKYLPFANGSEEELPPIEVPRFKYWLCQSCLQDCGAVCTSQEASLVSQNGKDVVQPCTTSFPSLDCHGSAIIPFGEGTSGLKPVDKRSNDETVLSVLRDDKTQSSPEIRADIDVPEEPDKIGSADIDFVAPGIEEIDLRDHEDPNRVGPAKGALTCQVVQPMVQSDQQSDDPSGHPRRKARKVRLLTELLCGRTKEQHQRNENNNIDIVSSSSSSQMKRKVPQAQDQGHVGKKIKAVKTSTIEHSQEPEADLREQKTDKYQCKKHTTQRNDPMAAWRSIFSDRPVSATNGASRGKGMDPSMAPPHPEKKSNAFKKIFDNPLKNHFFQEDLHNLGASRVRNSESDVGLGLDLSLNYDPQALVCSQPPLPNRVPVQDHNRKAGFFFGESSINHRVTSDPRAKERSVYEHTPKMAFLQEQQHYHTHSSFSQHQNLDFSDPHNKRNGGFRAYSDVMRPNNHQRQDMFSNGRSDEKEIIELMAKIQHERNNNNNNNNGLPNKPSFRKVNSNKPIPAPIPQYPAGFFHQERVPAFPMFDTFSQYQKHLSNGPPRHHNLHYYESRGNNMQIMEALNKYHDGTQKSQTPRNAWSNIPTSMSFSHKNKGKNIMNLDLNVTAPNALDEYNDLETFDMNQNRMGSLDSSYSNEAIPAMQLLSLMDAGKSNLTFSKPFSPCYHHRASPSSAATNSFSSLFQTDKTFEGHSNGRQFFHKPQQKKPRGLSSASISHKYKPDDSFVFPFQWRDAGQDRSECVAKEGLGPRNGSLGTGVCTINRNPADFSTPGPENVYMISANDLIIRGEHCYKSRFASERQKR